MYGAPRSLVGTFMSVKEAAKQQHRSTGAILTDIKRGRVRAVRVVRQGSAGWLIETGIRPFTMGAGTGSGDPTTL